MAESEEQREPKGRWPEADRPLESREGVAEHRKVLAQSVDESRHHPEPHGGEHRGRRAGDAAERIPSQSCDESNEAEADAESPQQALCELTGPARTPSEPSVGERPTIDPRHDPDRKSTRLNSSHG